MSLGRWMDEEDVVGSCRSVTQSCPALCDPIDCSTPVSSVFHYLLEFTQIHVHRVGDAIQPSRPLSSPSLPALNLPQHQGLSQWVSSSHQVAKVLELQLQLQSFQWIFIYNGILFSHEQGWNNAICGNMTGSRDYHPTWSQPDKDQIHDTTCMWNLNYNTDEHIYKTEIDSQTWKQPWLPNGKVRRDELGVWG